VVVLFWFLLGLLLTIYVAYPLLTIVIAALRPKPKYIAFTKQPRVAVIVAAYNEEAIIAEKIENLLKLDYPKDSLEIIIVADGSTDKTYEIVEMYADRRIKLMRGEQRVGKTRAMNLALHSTTADIIIYTDADPILDRSAVIHLVTPFSDPRVGIVCGNALYGKGEEHHGSEQESVYWHIENWLRYSEGRAYNSLLGGVGELFAVRREDADELPDNISHDFMTQVLMRAKGKYVLFEPRALAFAKGSKVLATEYHRKMRIVFQTAYSVLWKLEVLNPFKHFILAYQLWLHKVLRWFSGLWLLPLLPLSYFLQDESPFYSVFFWALAAFYGLAILGYLATKAKIRLGAFGLPFYVNMVYIAAIHGIIKLLWERPAPTWTIVRTQEQS